MGILLRRGACAAAIATLALTAGCAGQDPEPSQPQELTISSAGGVYLDAVCPVNGAWDHVDLELDRLRLGLKRGEVDTQAFASALKSLSAASEKAAKQLTPKDRAWPEEAKAPIAEVEDTLLADQKQALRAAKLSAKEAVDYVWKGSEGIAQSAAEARAALGLPADPELACAQWREQQKSEKDTKDAKGTKESSD